jgi:phytoene dehydrogenase-like protein
MSAAQEQVGGRVRTEIIHGFPFDHGAQFVHGEIGNPLYDYAARNALLSNLPSFEGEGNKHLSLNHPEMSEQ